MRRRILWAGTVLLVLLLGAAGVLVLSGLREDVRKTDAALVLGSKVDPGGKPSVRLKARLDRAAELYKQGCFPLIIASGGHGIEGYPEGTVMKEYLVAQGVPAEVIIADNEGVDTWSSALNTAAILHERGGRSVFVVTQYFHLPRSRMALRKCGVTDIASAYPHFFEPRDAYSIAREMAGVGKYALIRPDSEQVAK